MNTLDTMNTDKQEAILQNGDVLSLDLADDDVFRITKRIDTGKQFWNTTFDLDNVQKLCEKYWLNKSVDEKALYPFNVPYKDNRIFQSIETIIPQVLANPVLPLVTEAFDTDASRELAHNLEHTLLALYYNLEVEGQVGMVIRHLLAGMRYGVMKYRLDPDAGYLNDKGERVGQFVVEYINPTSVVFDAKARRSHVPLMAEYITNTGDEMIEKFPDKKDELYKLIKAEGKQTNDILTYPELWFEYMKDGKTGCGVTWKYGNILLGKMKNPHWNYENEEANFFDRPRFPYVVFNYLSMGRYIVDDTSLTEQAMNQQDILNKRGRQIVENADSANGGKVFNSLMIRPEDASMVVGDPNEAIMVKGNPNEAFARMAPPALPDYVIQDKFDARQEIDNIFGTHAPLKGEGSNSPTLGQEMISQNQDKSRLQTITKSVERGMRELYQGLTQMIVVFWDSPTQVAYTGVDGKSIHMEFDGSKIQKGIKVSVKAGASLPKDKVTMLNVAMKLGPMLDPLSLGEALDKDNPKEFAKRIVLFKADLQRYMSEVLGENPQGNMDQKAMADIQALVQGTQIPVPQSPTQEYVSTFQTFIQSPAFGQLPPTSQQQIVLFAKQILAGGRSGLMIQSDSSNPNTQQGAPQGQPMQMGQPPQATPQMPPPIPPTAGIGATQGFSG